MTTLPKTWSKARFYFIVVVPAAVLMALEMVSSRLLAPEFGSSVHVWGSIISIFLAAMSIGYFWGGRLADRRPELSGLGHILLVAAFFQALLLVLGETAVSSLAGFFGNGAVGTLVTVVVIFAPPTIPLAMVSPYLIRIAALDLKELGSTAGHLYALSTAGSLAGTLGATFVLIPTMSLRPILSLLLATTTVSALLLLTTTPPRRRLSLVLGASLLLLSVLPEHLLHSSELNVLVKRMSAYQTLSVVEIENVRYLHSDGELHGAVDINTGQPVIPYAKWVPAAYFIHPDMKRVALIGVGSGSVASYLHKADPELQIDQIDVDQAVIDLAVEYFQVEPSDNNRLHVADGRRFLDEREDERWDLIYLDTYIGHSIPFHLSTIEFFRLIKSRLAPGGAVGMNFIGALDSPFGSGMLRTMSEVFRFIYIVPIGQSSNYLLIATAKGPRLSREDVRVAGQWLDERFPALEVSGQTMAKSFNPIDLDLTGANVFEDQYAPVNHLRRDRK